MPIRGSPNGAAHSQCTLFHSHVLVDAIARNRWTPSLGLAVDVINRYSWTSSIGIAGRHHSVRPLFSRYRKLITERMAAARLPAIYQWPEMAEEGGLIAYGPRFAELYRPYALQVVKVLKGTKIRRHSDRAADQVRAGDQPQDRQVPRITVPPALLARADEVVEWP